MLVIRLYLILNILWELCYMDHAKTLPLCGYVHNVQIVIPLCVCTCMFVWTNIFKKTFESQCFPAFHIKQLLKRSEYVLRPVLKQTWLQTISIILVVFLPISACCKFLLCPVWSRIFPNKYIHISIPYMPKFKAGRVLDFS